MQLLAEREADTYNNEIEGARSTVNTLAIERKQILKENTYGKNTTLVADKLAEQIKETAAQCAEISEKVQSAYEGQDVALKSATTSLSGYTSEQLKSIDLSDGQYAQGKEMEQALENTMDVLGVSADQAEQFKCPV